MGLVLFSKRPFHQNRNPTPPLPPPPCPMPFLSGCAIVDALQTHQILEIGGGGNQIILSLIHIKICARVRFWNRNAHERETCETKGLCKSRTDALVELVTPHIPFPNCV